MDKQLIGSTDLVAAIVKVIVGHPVIAEEPNITLGIDVCPAIAVTLACSKGVFTPVATVAPTQEGQSRTSCPTPPLEAPCFRAVPRVRSTVCRPPLKVNVNDVPVLTGSLPLDEGTRVSNQATQLERLAVWRNKDLPVTETGITDGVHRV